MRAIAISALIFAVGCNSSSSSDSQDVTVVFGAVTAADGSGISGVRVTGGGAVASTEADGSYQLTPPASGVITITFNKDGFLEARRSSPVLDSKPTALHAVLVPMADPVQLDAAMGGAADGARGSSVLAPPGAFVNPMGASVEGMVDVHLTPLDPGKVDEVNAVTDNFVGRDGNTTTLIESFGMLEITIRQDGATLDVADGMALDITIPAPEGMDTPPSTVPLWSLDEQTNEWVREGEATYDAENKVYRAQIAHMSAWNVDMPAEATCITGVAKTTDDAALPGARVVASGVDYFGTSTTATSGEDGRFYVAVRRDSTISVTVSHAAGGGMQRTVMSGSAPTNVPVRPDIDECLDVGEWIVEQGVVTIEDSNGGTRRIDCRNVGTNPFAGTCAEGMFSLFECWQPQGTCDVRFTTLNAPFEIVYSNGAKATAESLDENGVTNLQYINAAGQVCGTANTVGDSSALTMTVNGQSWTIPERAEGDTNFTLVCPSGETLSFPQSEIDALQSCGLGAGDTEDQQCTVNGEDPNQPAPPPGGGGPGETGSSCMGDGECNGALECCDIPGANGQGVCFDRMICEAVRQQGN